MAVMDTTPEPGAEGRAPFHAERPADPCALVLFGATGDLAKRKLIPGLYNLHRDGLLPAGFAVIGVGRSVGSLDELRAQARANVVRFSRTPVDAAAWDGFAARIDYVRGDIDAAETYEELRGALARADQSHGSAGNRLYCMAVPPSSFGVILGRLRGAGLLYEATAANGAPWSRVMIEKPFGRDLHSARALNQMAASFLD